VIVQGGKFTPQDFAKYAAKCRDIGEFESLAHFHLLAHGLEVPLHAIDTNGNAIDQ